MKRLFALMLTMAFLCIGSAAMADEPEPFDLNKATVEQLMSIPDANITEEMAKAMIEMSKATPFRISDDLLKVPGLDNGTLEAINPVEEHDSLWYDPDNAEMVLAPSKC